ncbi:MAG: hypothetical protein AAF631_12045 [Pseudomonadota bacterium]
MVLRLCGRMVLRLKERVRYRCKNFAVLVAPISQVHVCIKERSACDLFSTHAFGFRLSSDLGCYFSFLTSLSAFGLACGGEGDGTHPSLPILWPSMVVPGFATKA